MPVATRPAPLGESVSSIDALLDEINRLGGKAQRLNEQAVGDALEQLVELESVKQAALWATPDLARLKIADRLRALGVEIVPPNADKFI